ncbi:MAG: DUF4465 domain-containing protein [Alistipes sp.]|nr:DUF4465 domain-containing protein [Alistipes sp.]
MKKIFNIAIAALAVTSVATGCNDTEQPQTPTPTIFDFESVPAASLAGPTSYGDNLYATFEGSRFTSYTDPATGLKFDILPDSKSEFNFWNGGIALSQWNDMATAGYGNQCSVYYKDATTGFGGQGGSKTFAVVNVTDYNGDCGFSFADPQAEAKFDHFWVTNSTYAALSMLNGDGEGDVAARKFEAGDWFKLSITAKDKDGKDTGSPVEFLLADMGLKSAGVEGGHTRETGILAPVEVVKEWTKVDLTPLGDRVHTVNFKLTSTDNNEYGMKTPAYFCFDSVAYFKPAE